MRNIIFILSEWDDVDIVASELLTGQLMKRSVSQNTKTRRPLIAALSVSRWIVVCITLQH
jgi:hypothetical protein